MTELNSTGGFGPHGVATIDGTCCAYGLFGTKGNGLQRTCPRLLELSQNGDTQIGTFFSPDIIMFGSYTYHVCAGLSRGVPNARYYTNDMPFVTFEIETKLVCEEGDTLFGSPGLCM